MRWLFLTIGLFFCSLSWAMGSSEPSKASKDVHIALFINDISKFDGRAETIQFEVSVFLSWQDDTLRPTQTQYYPGHAVVEKAQTIWWPYLKIQQARGMRQIESRVLTVSPQGLVRYQERFSTIVETNLDMTLFPFDKQKIKISIAPFGPSRYTVNLVPEPNHQGIAGNAHLDEWTIKHVGYQTLDTENAQGAMKSHYIVHMDYQRKASFYVVKIFIPLLTIVILSWSVLWLLNQPFINLISVVLVALLTIVAFQWAVMESSPKVPYLMYFEALLLFVYISVGSMVVFLTLFANMDKADAERLAYHLRYLYPSIFLLGAGLITTYYFM